MTPAERISIDASALLTTYADVHVLELVIGGASRVQANQAGYVLLHFDLAPLTGSPPGEPPRAATVKCVAERSAVIAGWLGQTLGAKPPPPPALVPSTIIDRGILAALLWQAETVRRLELGTPLLEAARGAHDAHLGKPRRRRAPVERSWLAQQVNLALWEAWRALLYSRYAGRPWLEADRLAAAGMDADHRPIRRLDLEGR
jgi:hypothetical protein